MAPLLRDCGLVCCGVSVLTDEDPVEDTVVPRVILQAYYHVLLNTCPPSYDGEVITTVTET